MRLLDLTFAGPEENLACDEALLDEAEEGSNEETLRFWEPRSFFVVLGYSRPAAAEIHLDRCNAERVPVLRRYSGGGTVLQGPGCLNFSLILRIQQKGPLSTITGTTSFIMDRHARSLERLLQRPVNVMGESDLAIGGMKFSGNAQRRRENFLLFHGTFLLRFDLERIGRLLAMPVIQPAYREKRPHETFVVNIGLAPVEIRKALTEVWEARGGAPPAPAERIRDLVVRRYTKTEWNFRR
jgi:lipoate---protein ligase